MYHSVADNDVFFTVKPKIFAQQMAYLKKRNYQALKLSELIDFLESKTRIPKKAFVLTFDDGYEDNYFNAWPIFKKYNFPATIFLAAGLAGGKINNVSNIPLKALNWQEIEEMHWSGLIDFEPHTVSHQRFERLNLNQIEQEIIISKKMIEERLNKKCHFFAYPRGWYNEKIIGILKKQGFRAARTTETGKINKGDNPFKLKRISVNSTMSFIQFRAMIQ